MFKPQDRRETSRRTLKLLHTELEALVPSKDVEKEQPTAVEAEMSEEDNESSFEDVLSGASDESQ